MRVGFIGLGHMGRGMVELLESGGDDQDWSAVGRMALRDAANRGPQTVARTHPRKAKTNG